MSGKSVVTFKRLRSDFGIPYSRTHLDRLEKAKRFPQSFKLSPYRGSPRVWWVIEVIEYLERCAKARSDAPK
ncbi:putative DNA-binding transcriptional regulator AlpA [Bradyrhizobium sp. USDA 4011]